MSQNKVVIPTAMVLLIGWMFLLGCKRKEPRIEWEGTNGQELSCDKMILKSNSFTCIGGSNIYTCIAAGNEDVVTFRCIPTITNRFRSHSPEKETE
jgi:hypothetical protein